MARTMNDNDKLASLGGANVDVGVEEGEDVFFGEGLDVCRFLLRAVKEVGALFVCVCVCVRVCVFMCLSENG